MFSQVSVHPQGGCSGRVGAMGKREGCRGRGTLWTGQGVNSPRTGPPPPPPPTATQLTSPQVCVEFEKRPHSCAPLTNLRETGKKCTNHTGHFMCWHCSQLLLNVTKDNLRSR